MHYKSLNSEILILDKKTCISSSVGGFGIKKVTSS
jgi:hypothetical protein